MNDEQHRPMNGWEWLHRLGPGWPSDGRGWIGFSVFVLTVMVLWMVAERKDLREDEFFKVIATAIVLTGFVQGVVGWAYSATKGGGELADANAKIVGEAATASSLIAAQAADRVGAEPQDVTIVGQAKPVDVKDAIPGASAGAAGEKSEPVAPDSRIPEVPLSDAPSPSSTDLTDLAQDAAPSART